MRCQVGDIAFLEKDMSLRWWQSACDNVEQGSFTGTVRANNCVQSSRFKREIDIIERFQSAKMFRQVLYFQQGTHARAPERWAERFFRGDLLLVFG